VASERVANPSEDLTTGGPVRVADRRKPTKQASAVRRRPAHQVTQWKSVRVSIRNESRADIAFFEISGLGAGFTGKQNPKSPVCRSPFVRGHLCGRALVVLASREEAPFLHSPDPSRRAIPSHGAGSYSSVSTRMNRAGRVG
jgi:hypothetical protein